MGPTSGRSVVVVLVLVATLAAGCGGDEAVPSASSPASTSAPSVQEPTTPPPSSVPPAPTPTTSAPTAGPTGPPAVPEPAVPEALLGRDWEHLPTDRQVVALTFDGGGSDAAVPSVLATLADAEVPATFFLTGDFARRYPTRVQQITAAGHRLGNHSNRHPQYPDLTDAQILQDLQQAEEAIRSAGGASPRPLFRFPFGARTEADVRAVNDAGYVPVRWTTDTLGWQGTSGGMTADEVLRRVVDTARPGQIVLMHVGANPDDGTTLDADALPRVIDALRDRGYGFVTLDALLDGV